MISRISALRDEHGATLGRRAQAAQLWTLYGASFETTATALLWAILHLAWNPGAAQRLLADLTQSGPEAKYLEAVIYESLRMSPPVPFQIRRSAGEAELGGVQLMRGDRIFLSAATMNRDPAIYPEPHTFHPERWLNTEPTALRPLAFSAGPRRCLGYGFAITVLKCALAGIWPTLRLGVPARARIGVRIAITQSPNRMPLAATAQDGGFAEASFSGAAARQMTRRQALPRRQTFALQPTAKEQLGSTEVIP
jgi:cytochrome P450